MESNVDKIITLSDDQRFYVMDEIFKDDHRYMLLSRIDKDDNLTQEVNIVEETETDEGITVKSIENEELLNKIVEEFSRRLSEEKG